MKFIQQRIKEISMMTKILTESLVDESKYFTRTEVEQSDKYLIVTRCNLLWHDVNNSCVSARTLANC